MQKCQNIKNNLSEKVGVVSCLLLLLVTFLVINPIVNSSAFAEDHTEDNYFETSFSSSNTYSDADDTASLLADTPSTVNISFAPAFGSASLSPTTSAGKSAQINVLATVSVQNSGGYSVYLKGDSVNLVGQNNGTNFIPGTPMPKTYADMDVNTWGYFAKEGTTIPDNATYRAVAISDNGEKIIENTEKKIFSDAKDIMLSFAAKVNDAKPADTYKNTITLSIVSSPIQTTLTNIVDMQDMTNDICAASATYETKQLRDARDGKFYWVTKLADNKCWMTQNLDLDLSTSITLTPVNTDVVTNYTPVSTTATVASEFPVDSTSQRSWSLGNYRIADPTAVENCGTKLTSAAGCPSRFIAYNTPTTANGDDNAHYILGNHYQWYTATAGTGGTLTNGQASSSICPKGWRLPTGGSSGEFKALTVAGEIATGSDSGDTIKIIDSPYYFVRGGVIYRDDDLFSNGGRSGGYWSSTPRSDVSNAHLFFFSDIKRLVPSDDISRWYGYSVRCLAR